jgi:hypothetical protein
MNIFTYPKEGIMFNFINMRPTGVAKAYALVGSVLASGIVFMLSLSAILLGGFAAILFLGGFTLELVGLATYNIEAAEAQSKMLQIGFGGLIVCAVGVGLTKLNAKLYARISDSIDKHNNESEFMFAMITPLPILLAGLAIYYGFPTAEQWQAFWYLAWRY